MKLYEKYLLEFRDDRKVAIGYLKDTERFIKKNEFNRALFALKSANEIIKSLEIQYQ